jgi:NAD(P)-dependent dehydrogenase (short-subunit alcohol dehydrogenase family)
MGILGLTQTLALEGAKHGITANVVVPIAESKMTETVLPGVISRALVLVLCPLATARVSEGPMHQSLSTAHKICDSHANPHAS